MSKLYTSKVVAQWIGLTERRVRQLRDEGIITEERPGLYDLQKTVLKYIKYLGGTGKESLQTERMKLTAARRAAIEMENNLRNGQMHTTEDVERGIKTLCLNIRSRLLVLPSKLSAELATRSNQAEVFDILHEAIYEALDGLADVNTSLADIEGSDGKDD